MDELISMFEINPQQFLINIVAVILAVKYLISLTDWILQRFGIEFKGSREKKEDHELVKKVSAHQEEIDNKLKTLIDSVSEVTQKIDSIDERSKNTEIATKESLADRIGQKYYRYINDLHGIPSDEVDEFVNLHAAYKLVGGNHSGDAKFKYCMEHLPIIDASAELTFEER